MADITGAFFIQGTPQDDTITGTDLTSDTIYGLGGNDTINGLGGPDTIFGGLGNNTMSGGSGGDTIVGDFGNDEIIGGANGVFGEPDILTGGFGLDRFRYNSPNEGSDTIVDFTPFVDKIVVSKSGFGLDFDSTLFGIPADRFVVGTAAGDANDRFIYNGNQLFFDADGNGAGLAQPIARFSNGARLTAFDIQVV